MSNLRLAPYQQGAPCVHDKPLAGAEEGGRGTMHRDPGTESCGCYASEKPKVSSVFKVNLTVFASWLTLRFSQGSALPTLR